MVYDLKLLNAEQPLSNSKHWKPKLLFLWMPESWKNLEKDVARAHITTAFDIWMKNEGFTASYILSTNSFSLGEAPSALNCALSKSFCPAVVHNKGFG